MTDLQSLLSRIEAASGPDREIDRAIGFALDGWTVRNDITGYTDCDAIVTGDGNVFVDDPGGMYPSFTESLDAAVALVEKMLGNRWNVYGVGQAVIHIDDDEFVRDAGATPALALCAALIKALIQSRSAAPVNKSDETISPDKGETQS